MAGDHRTTEITLYLQGGHAIHLATGGLDDHTIPQMRNDLKERWTAAPAEPGVLELVDGTIIRADRVVAMSVDDVEYVDDPTGPGRRRIVSSHYDD